MVFSFRQRCVGLEDDPTCGKPLTTQNPGSLQIHELMARGHQTTPKSIKYQLHIYKEMMCQIHWGSAMHLFHCLMHKLILIPPCQCRATWPITAEWYRPGTHTIHMTSKKSTFFYSLQRKLPSKNTQWHLGYQEEDKITIEWKCTSIGHSW
jgi:hypothetical protein